MNKIKSILIAGILLSINFSCDDNFLDQVPDDRLTLAQTFSHRSTAEQYLANVYSRIPDESLQRSLASDNSGPWTGASDEGEFVWTGVATNNINIGSYDPTTGWVSTLWSNWYRGIRASSEFMKSIDQCQDCNEQRITQLKAEAKALRAMYYFYLMRMFGPVIILSDEALPSDVDSDLLQVPRSSLDETVAYIAGELEQAAADLPVSSTGEDLGRITKGIALAFRSEAFLYAASPLFNGNTDYASLINTDGKQLISQQYDVNKWKVAADAAKAFIDQFVPSKYDLYRKNNATTGTFDPYLSTRDVILDDWNREIILARMSGQIAWMHYERTPFHSGAASGTAFRGSGGMGATQNIVDAYFTSNGRSIEDPLSGYEETGFTTFRAPYDDEARTTFSQWANREPRFYVGITYDNSLWLNTGQGKIITRTHYNGNSGRKVGGNDYTPTGYVVRKNVAIGDNTNRTVVLLRLAQIYLNYVEALNEYNPNHPDILIYLNAIRNRAGIPEYGSADLEAPASQEAMREAIHKERQVELAFENDRYFAARRWKIAEMAFNGPMYGLDINANDINNFYNKVPFETRVFTKRNYLFPIPQDEVNSDKALVQNTGW